MTEEIKKKIIVDKDVYAKISEWLDAGRMVYRLVCPDLGCLAEHFSPNKESRCSRHSWEAKLTEQGTVTIDDLEIAPPAPVKPKGTPDTFRVVNFDVWGNVEDGWEVNQAFDSGITVRLKEGFEDKDVRDVLVEAGVLKGTYKAADLEIDGDDQIVTVEQETDGYPLCNLEMLPYSEGN